jgi:hypothetical protein
LPHDCANLTLISFPLLAQIEDLSSAGFHHADIPCFPGSPARAPPAALSSAVDVAATSIEGDPHAAMALKLPLAGPLETDVCEADSVVK